MMRYICCRVLVCVTDHTRPFVLVFPRFHCLCCIRESLACRFGACLLAVRAKSGLLLSRWHCNCPASPWPTSSAWCHDRPSACHGGRSSCRFLFLGRKDVKFLANEGHLYSVRPSASFLLWPAPGRRLFSCSEVVFGAILRVGRRWTSITFAASPDPLHQSPCEESKFDAYVVFARKLPCHVLVPSLFLHGLPPGRSIRARLSAIHTLRLHVRSPVRSRRPAHQSATDLELIFRSRSIAPSSPYIAPRSRGFRVAARESGS